MVVLHRDEREIARWPLRTPERLDLTVVDDIARLHLRARRAGCRVELRHVCPRLRTLLDLVGLSVEVLGQPEGGEEGGGVEEVVVPDDGGPVG